MTNRKATKRALLLSALSVLLCVSMLIGTTYAWFTDSVTSSGNIIKSGTLDVAMYWADGTEAVPAKDSTDWADASEGAIFEYDKWEPGFVQVRHLKIANEGTLALKYQLHIVANGEVSELADAIDVYYVDPAVQVAERTALNDDMKLGTLTQVLAAFDTTASGNLAAGEEVAVTLALKMRESAGNEYQDLEIGSDFAVQLLATQLTAEKDSFDDQYDIDSDYVAEVKTADELAVALQAGGLIKLLDDATVEETLKVPAGVIAILDLNGKTITGTGNGATLINNGTLTVKGGTVKNTTVNGGATIKNEGNLVLDDANIVGAPIARDAGYPSYCITSAGTLTIEEGTTVSADRGCLNLSGTGTTTINGGTFTNNDLATKIDRAFTSHVLVVGYGANNKLTINGGTFKHLHTSTSGGVVINNWSAVTVDVKGGNFSGGNYWGKWDNLSDYGYKSTDTPFAVTGGTFTGIDSNYVAAGYAVVDNGNGTYTVVEGVAVKDAAGLQAAIKDASATEETIINLAGGTYSENLDLTVKALGSSKGDLVFKAVKGADVVLSGTITLGYRKQGTGATMMNADVTFEGITFDQANAATHSLDVQDVNSLTLKNCTIIGDGEYGITSANGNATGKSTIVDCTFINAGMQIKGNFGTGLVIDNCTFTNSRVNVQGGNGVTVQNCKFTDTLSDAKLADSFYLIRSNSTPITVKNCDITVDSTVTGVATAQTNWGIFWNRGTTNWTVEDVNITLTDAALAQTELLVTKTTSTGAINTTNLKVNGVAY